MERVVIAALVLICVHFLISSVIFFTKKDRLMFIPNFNNYNSSWFISMFVCLIIIILLACSYD